MNDAERGIRTYMIYGMYNNMNTAAFHQYLIDSIDILSYWNHMPLLYFVKSRSTPFEMAAKIRPFFGGTWFIVNEVVPGAGDGWLPKPAWDWFTTPAPNEKTTSSPRQQLADLFVPPPPPIKG